MPAAVLSLERPTGADALASGTLSSVLDLQARAGEGAALLKALANPDRLMLLCQLVDSERGVGALGRLTGIAQPSLSQQLRVLRGERLVATRREGKQVVYRIASPAALAVLQTLYGLFCEGSRKASPVALLDPIIHPALKAPAVRRTRRPAVRRIGKATK